MTLAPAALVLAMRDRLDICANWTSKGAVTLVAITSGDAPG